MANIKAFVGHSFTDDDDHVVASFLKIFDQIKGVLPSFDWTHAKQAEPEELAKKVLRLVADCNTFIAICTKKELVAPPEALSQRLLTSESSIIKNDQLEWKTSDWIVQEIGLAVGRSMSLVILLESGCRRPGGLQGDVEFIPFDRTAPEKAFGQILEMLRAIDPPMGSRVESSPDSDAEIGAATSQESSAAAAIEGDEAPKSDWTIGNYETAFFWKVIRRDLNKADEISKAFHASDLAISSEIRAEWDAKCEEWLLRLSDKGRLATLKELHEKFIDNIRIKTSYASALSFYSKHEESAELYESASNLADDASQKLTNMTKAALEQAKAGNLDLGADLLNKAKDIVNNDQDLDYQLALGIRNYAEKIKDNELRIEAMEKMLSVRPDDDDTRFSLAYAHSELENDDMALHHYLTIPYSRRTPYTWNNLGVAYQNFSVPARSIEAFEKAAEEGNTLAMSNLAYRYLHVGFLREARGQLDKALTEKDPHKNVNEAYASLTSAPDNETKAVDEVLESTAKKVETFKMLSGAICDPDITELANLWIFPNAELSVIVVGRHFEARGRYEVKGNAFSGLLGATKSSEYELILKGNIFGRRVFGEVERKSLGATPTSLLGGADTTKRFAIVFDRELQTGHVIESINTRSPSYYEISAKPEPASSEDGDES